MDGATKDSNAVLIAKLNALDAAESPESLRQDQRPRQAQAAMTC